MWHGISTGTLYFAVCVTLLILFTPLVLSNLWRAMAPLVESARERDALFPFKSAPFLASEQSNDNEEDESAKPLLVPPPRSGPPRDIAWAKVSDDVAHKEWAG